MSKWGKGGQKKFKSYEETLFYLSGAEDHFCIIQNQAFFSQYWFPYTLQQHEALDALRWQTVTTERLLTPHLTGYTLPDP